MNEQEYRIEIRNATSKDVSLIFSFIQKKAEFDRTLGAFSGLLRTSEEKIFKTQFGPVPFAYVLFAVASAEKAAAQEIGFALYGFRYSSFAGQPSIWLDDLYVDQKMRSRGAGKTLMNYLANIAQNHDCTHLGWHADARNLGAIRFYRQLGAEIVGQIGHRCELQWRPSAES